MMPSLRETKEVVVIPARLALHDYEDFHAYICQAARTFQQVKYLAFYAKNQIFPIVPRIRESHDDVVFERGRYSGRLGELVAKVMNAKQNEPTRALGGAIQKVLLLSAPDAPETVKLQHAIMNDMVSRNGQRTAFTQNQRYVSLEALRRAKKTSELGEA